MILRHARWVGRHASQIAEAIDAGHGPGRHIEVDSTELHRQLGSVYQMTLTPHYLWRIADSFWRCSDLMVAMQPDGPVAGGWDTVIGYLKGTSETVAVGIDQAPPPDGAEVTDNTMELLRYEEFAKLMHPELVGNLHNSAASVADYCRLFAPLAPDETQLACLHALAAGQNQAGLAAHFGYSKRHVQRILADMWDQFDMETAAQGVAFAVAQGWITIPTQSR